MNNRTMATLLVALAVGTSAPALASGDDDYIHCLLTDGTHSTVYFSGVFLGDYSHKERYENAFTDYVHAEYDNVIGTASCFFEDNPSAARAEQNDLKAGKRSVYRSLITTGWTY